MGWKFWERDTSEAEQSLARLQQEAAAPVQDPTGPSTSQLGAGDTITA